MSFGVQSAELGRARIRRPIINRSRSQQNKQEKKIEQVSKQLRFKIDISGAKERGVHKVGRNDINEVWIEAVESDRPYFLTFVLAPQSTSGVY